MVIGEDLAAGIEHDAGAGTKDVLVVDDGVDADHRRLDPVGRGRDIKGFGARRAGRNQQGQ